MGRRTELLNGGLVTDRDPALLKPGQLAAMRNVVYKNGGDALIRAPGRSSFGTVAASTASGVSGIRDIHFDNGDHYLVAMANTKYRFAPVGVMGTFTDLATIASGTSLEVIHYRNRFFLVNGASADTSAIGTNAVVYLSATATGTAPTVRQHGMQPVESAPNVTTGAGAFSQTVTGYYEYWTTEVAKFKQDDAEVILESAYSSDNGVSTVLVSATSVLPTIQQPTLANALTTHWRIYRSPKKDLAADKKFPVGFMIAELSTGASAHADTTSVASASSFPASFNGSGFYFGFVSASSMASDNGVYASGAVGSIVAQTIQGAYNFSLGGFRGVVKGIKVEVEAYVSAGSAPLPVKVSIGRRRSDGHFLQKNTAKFGSRPTFVDIVASKAGTITSTNPAAPTLLSLGGSDDRWFPTNEFSLVDTDFDTNFMVALSVSQANTTIGVDFVRVTVYYGASVDSTVQFPTVVYTFGDISAQVAKNFPPPSSNTGDMYQDSLVVNDVLNASTIRYSFPGEPESFPPTYFIDFETRENDQVRAIRTVNNRLIVGLDTSLWRVNYLPNERDASFDRGRATEIISRTNGIVNPMCCCTFTIDGEAEQLAFVSYKGIHTTDAFNFITRSKNQTWRNYMPTGSSTPIALVNDPENRSLRFFFQTTAFGTTETEQCLWMSYDRKDIDAEGNFKFSGPVNMRNFVSSQRANMSAAWAVPRSNGDTTFYFGYSGTAAGSTAAGAGSIYVEQASATIPAADPRPQWTSRTIYAAGFSGEWMLDDLYGYCGDYSGAPVLVYTVIGNKTNDVGPQTLVNQYPAGGITLGGQALHRINPRTQSEGMTIRMQATATGDFQQEFIVLGSQVFGMEDSGL